MMGPPSRSPLKSAQDRWSLAPTGAELAQTPLRPTITAVTRCSDCGAKLPPDEPNVERRPCPNCGSLRRTYEKGMTATVNLSGSVEASVERGVNETRMAAFFVIFTTVVGVGMTVGFATCAWLGVLAAVLTAATTALLIAVVYRVRRVRQVVMELMHRITGQ